MFVRVAYSDVYSRHVAHSISDATTRGAESEDVPSPPREWPSNTNEAVGDSLTEVTISDPPASVVLVEKLCESRGAACSNRPSPSSVSSVRDTTTKWGRYRPSWTGAGGGGGVGVDVTDQGRGGVDGCGDAKIRPKKLCYTRCGWRPRDKRRQRHRRRGRMQT